MITLERSIAVNPPGTRSPISRAEVWQGLVRKADNALPFVPQITSCKVIERETATRFVRDIELGGAKLRERVELTPERQVTFTRLAGPVLGTIRNMIDDTPEGLALRFAFALEVTGASPAEEAAYARTMEQAYLGAVDATLAAIRTLHDQAAARLDPRRIAAITDQLGTDQLGPRFTGDIIGPDHADYPARSVVWNAMVRKRPGLILRCKTTQDVVAAVNVARGHGLHPSVRCGGHQVAGNGLSDGGLTIDLGGMRTVRYDPATGHVDIAGGCLLGDVDAETANHGVIVPAGIMSETGVAGLALGGGIGWFSRPYGLTCDQFVSLELVLASGEVIEVNQASHPELFWGLKGGGGNFGIVTRFTVKSYSFGPMMRIGAALYDTDGATEALREYARIYPTLPRHVGWHAALKPSMPKLPFVTPELVGKRLVMFITMWLGDAEDPEGIAMVERLNRVGRPVLTAMRTMPFAQGVQRILDEEFEDGHRYYTKEAHVGTLAPEAIDKLVAFWTRMPMDGEIEIIGLGGAIGDVAEADTAFSNRGYQMWLNFAMRWDDPADDPAYIAMTRACVAELKPWTGRGTYTNMLNADDNDLVLEAYGGAEKYARLGRLKATYDPDNLFRINANIVPAR
ncbi:MAG TPA: AtaL-like protein [Kofleriaceae bacterium]|jgi:FAD/FMN-containing dehydrogenase|nr:AtaL-like protein [Kofleriaceae bacterium]